MHIERTKIDHLHEQLDMQIEKNDYLPAYNKELKKIKKSARFEGFRPGNAPMSFVKKMYSHKILVGIIPKLIDENINKYIQENNLKLIGNVLPIGNFNEKISSLKVSESMDFAFEFGVVPEIEIDDSVQDLTKYEIVAEDEDIQSYFLALIKRKSVRKDVRTNIQEDDVIKISALEILTPTEDDKPSFGYRTEFNISVDLIGDEEVKSLLIGKDLGFRFDFNINTIDKTVPRDKVKKYILHLRDDDESSYEPIFLGKITGITKVIPPEINEEFFNENFGTDNVKNMQEAEAKIKSLLEKNYAKSAENLYINKLFADLLVKNEIHLPETFMERYLKFSNPNIAEDKWEEIFNSFLQSTKTAILLDKLVKKYDITTEYEDVLDSYLEKMGANSEALKLVLKSYAEKHLSDATNYHMVTQELQKIKISEAIQTANSIATQTVTIKEFDEIMTASEEEAIGV